VPWNGTDRITILAMGVDQRTTEAAHSDVMMVISLDPGNGHVSMLSIPRDTWVQLAEGGEGKINSAYAIGDGPYAKLVVANALGIPIDYYATLTFNGFKNLVDALGGVTIDVPAAIDDPTYPADVGFGYMPLHIRAGVQHMDGATALEYVRTRHEDPRGDVGRNDRQQNLLLALKQQALTPGTLLRLPAILAAFNKAVASDLPHDRLPEVLSLVSHAGNARLAHETLSPDNGAVSASTSWDGQWIFLPNWTVINEITARLLADPRLAAEHASVEVQNGTTTTGLARMLGSVLQHDGFTLTGVSDAASTDHPRSEVIVHDRAVAYSARSLAAMLHATYAEAPATTTAGTTAPQITVVVGADFPGAH
jgi:LCP family protein required for cell wall assembly